MTMPTLPRMTEHKAKLGEMISDLIARWIAYIEPVLVKVGLPPSLVPIIATVLFMVSMDRWRKPFAPLLELGPNATVDEWEAAMQVVKDTMKRETAGVPDGAETPFQERIDRYKREMETEKMLRDLHLPTL